MSVPGVDGRYLVDVGFGGQTLTSRSASSSAPVQQTRHEPYRIRERGDGLALEAQIRDKWQPLYMFSTRPQRDDRPQVGSWYVSTYPKSHFVTGLTARW